MTFQTGSKGMDNDCYSVPFFLENSVSSENCIRFKSQKRVSPIPYVFSNKTTQDVLSRMCYTLPVVGGTVAAIA